MQPILKVDLTSGEALTYTIPQEWQTEYLGGASLAARLLYESLTFDLDPFSAQAPLLFMNGPLTGSAGPAVGRFVVCGKSPATGLWAESNCGGFWGPELRMAGFDGLWITGRAEKPVYLWIEDSRVEIRPAGNLWGLETYATQAAVEAEIKKGKPRIAVIGPAGEQKIPYALILTDHGRVAGRTGMGAVMGSKNLKAIAVLGSGKIPVENPHVFTLLRSEANKHLRSDSMTAVLRELGSAGAAEYFDYLGEMPKRYFHAEIFDEATHISGASVKDSILAGVSACHACVIACGRVVRLPDGNTGEPGDKRKGPEYETLVGFGPNLWLNDPVFATRMGELCDRFGMDSISLSNTIGLAFLLYERGLITLKDTGGVALEWGSQSAVEQIVELTTQRVGIGALISEGARSLGRRFGAEDEAIQVNGLEVAYHDPRGASGMALVYATSPRGACHNQSDYFLVDIGQVESSLGLEYFSRHDNEEKAGNVARHQNWRTLGNSLVLCIFANVPPETTLALINAACGLHWKLDELMACGERGWNLKRVINYRLGLRRENDRLPKALMRPYPDDSRGTLSYAPNLEPMLQAYYASRGWDLQSGMPLRSTLQQLGLDWAANGLEND